MLSHVPGLQTYNSKQPFSLVNGVAVQIYRQASKLTSSPGSLRLHIKITCDYITLQIYMWSSISGVQKRTLVMSIATERITRRPPESCMACQLVNESVVSR